MGERMLRIRRMDSVVLPRSNSDEGPSVNYSWPDRLRWHHTRSLAGARDDCSVPRRHPILGGNPNNQLHPFASSSEKPW